jgi:hypothetical protein
MKSLINTIQEFVDHYVGTNEYQVLIGTTNDPMEGEVMELNLISDKTILHSYTYFWNTGANSILHHLKEALYNERIDNRC